LRKAQFNLYKYAEPRAIFELQSFYLTRALLKRLPKGDGHPVIVFPGFVGSDISTRPLRKLLQDLGYSSYGWGLGRNLLYNHRRENEMRRLVQKVTRKEGRKVSLIGWSLGGLFAREVAKAEPDSVRSVMSLGTPITGQSALTNAGDLFKVLNGTPKDPSTSRFAEFAKSPPVPTSSIYSKTDGIVAWEASVQKDEPSTENIIVPASHLGMGVNPLVMVVIADRLRQEEGAWKPFDSSGLKGLIYGDPKRPFSKTLKSIMRGTISA